MNRMLVAFLLVCASASAAHAQSDPSLKKEWGPMLSRVNAAAETYRAYLGLEPHWSGYCQTMANLEENRAPKDGMIPLGANWTTMGDEEFKAALKALEAYRKGAMMLCLADVKARLDAAERK